MGKQSKKLAKMDLSMAKAKNVKGFPFVENLTVWEVNNLRKYRRSWPACPYMLGQDAVSASNKGDGMVMLCEIHNQDMVFSDLDHRWLVPYEFLVFQGWPVYEELKKVCPVSCSFDVPSHRRNPDRVLEQAGNSIPLPIITLALLYCLSETDLRGTCAGRLSRAAEASGLSSSSSSARAGAASSLCCGA